MFRFPQIDDLPKFEVPTFDVPKLDLRELESKLRDLELPTFELPKFELPKFEGKLPDLDLPHFDLDAEIERVTGLVRDAAYVGIGAVVVVAEKADERRRELTDEVTTTVRKLVDQLT